MIKDPSTEHMPTSDWFSSPLIVQYNYEHNFFHQNSTKLESITLFLKVQTKLDIAS